MMVEKGWRNLSGREVRNYKFRLESRCIYEIRRKGESRGRKERDWGWKSYGWLW